MAKTKHHPSHYQAKKSHRVSKSPTADARFGKSLKRHEPPLDVPYEGVNFHGPQTGFPTPWTIPPSQWIGPTGPFPLALTRPNDSRPATTNMGQAPGITGSINTSPKSAMEEVTSPSAQADSDESDSEGEATTKPAKKVRSPRVVLKAVKVDELDNHWFAMFEALTQRGLKAVLNAWISSGHPQKQTKYPYKGAKKARVPQPAADAYDPDHNPGYYTAPEYWPTQEGWDHEGKLACRHLEPYHVKKKERQFLATHILLLNTPPAKEYDFNLDKLRVATNGLTRRQPQAFPDEADQYLEAIYTAAQKYKDLKDPNANVYIDSSSEVHVYVTYFANQQPKPSKRYNREYSNSGEPQPKKRRATNKQSIKKRDASPISVKEEVKSAISIASSRASSPDEDEDKTVNVKSQPESINSNSEASQSSKVWNSIARDAPVTAGSNAYGDNVTPMTGNIAHPTGFGYNQPAQQDAQHQFGHYWQSAPSSVNSLTSSFGSDITSSDAQSQAWPEYNYSHDAQHSRAGMPYMNETVHCCANSMMAASNGYGAGAGNPFAMGIPSNNNGGHVMPYTGLNPFGSTMNDGSTHNYGRSYSTGNIHHHAGPAYADMAATSAFATPTWAPFAQAN